MKNFDLKYLWGALALFTSLFFISLFDRGVHIDDAWLGEQVYFHLNFGYVKSALWKGLLSYENQLFVYHKGFILLGTLFSKAFGFSLVSLKSLSLLGLLGTTILLFKYIKSQLGPQAAIVSLILLISSHFVFELSFVFRPEITLMFLGFSCFLLLKKYFETGKILYLLSLSCIAGIAVFIHLNALIFFPALFMLLLLHKKYVSSLIFSVLSVSISCLYFADVGFENLNTWLFQFNNDPAVVNVKLSVYDRFANLFKEHQRWFSHPYNISFSLLFFYSLIKFRKEQNKDELVFLGFCVLSLSLLSHGQTGKYLLLFYPFLVLVIVRALQSLNKPNFAAIGLVCLMLISNTYYNILIIQRDDNLLEYNQNAFSHIPPNASVTSYLPSIFDSNIKKFDIRADMLNLFIQERYEEKVFDVREYFKYYKDQGIRYFVFSKKFTPKKILNAYDELLSQNPESLNGLNIHIAP